MRTLTHCSAADHRFWGPLMVLATWLSGCAYTVPDFVAHPGTMAKIEEAAKAEGCDASTYRGSGDYSASAAYGWVYDRVTVRCDETRFSVGQILRTAFDSEGGAEVFANEAWGCGDACKAYTDRIIARLRAADAPIVAAVEPQPEPEPAAEPEPEPAAEPEPVPEPEPVVVWSGAFFGDQGVGSLVTACEPTGAEVCDNGLDDDCNGAFDELGCLATTGLLQWTIYWTGPSDLDLLVQGPDGVLLSAEHGDGDAGVSAFDGGCVGDGTFCFENVYLPADSVVPDGTYRAWVELDSLAGARGDRPVELRFSGRVGRRVFTNALALAPSEGAAYHLALAVGPDADHDGVGDGEDACPDQAGRWFDDASVRGCPDQDGDAVPDRDDRCPAAPGLTQGDPTANGCPMTFGDALVTNFGVTITSRIEFDTAKATLRPEGKETLRNVARAILARPDAVRRMAVEGHTDNVGNREDNLVLSQARAAAVLDFLVAAGVAREVLVPQGFADLRPIATNDTAEGRQANRRVEFVILEPKPKAPERW